VKYKTVNIYSFSLSSWQAIVERLNRHIEANNVDGYYETVIGEMMEDNRLSLKAVDFDNKYWYEVDTLEDLKEAEKLFSPNIYEPVITEGILTKTSKILEQFPKGLKTRGTKLAAN